MKIIAKAYEEPFGDPSILPCTYLFSHIKDKNDFIITGDSCDAIFGNADMYRVCSLPNRLNLKFKRFNNRKCHKRYYRDYSEMIQVNILNRFDYSDKLLGVKGVCKNVEKVDSDVRNSLLFDLCNTVTEKFKVKTTALANYYNINNYTPYFDIDILQKTFEIPLRKIRRKGKGKYIFRKVLYNNIPEKYYAEYKKKGFGIPMKKWCQDVFFKEAVKLSDKEFIEKQNLFKYDELTKLFDDFKNEPDYNKSIVIWNYYVFQNWYKENF